MTAFLWERLKLSVNAAKSAVARPWVRKFLGYSVTAHKETRLRIAPQSLACLRARVTDLCLKPGRGADNVWSGPSSSSDRSCVAG